jgi:hypothetical protein
MRTGSTWRLNTNHQPVKDEVVIMNIARIASALITIAGFPAWACAACDEDIIGKWQTSYVEFAGNRVNDDTQSWEFMANGKVRFMKTRPAIDVSADYECDGNIIYMKGSVPGRLKIVGFDGQTMAWESLDHGPGVMHVVRVD